MSEKTFDMDRVSTIEKTHEFLRRQENDVYGPFSLYKHHATDELVIMKEKTTNSKVELAHEMASVERRYNFRHPNLLEMIDWSVKKQSQLCATFYKIRTFFKFHATNLNHLINQRKREGKMLDDTEIMQLTYDGVDALGYLQSQNTNHGYLRPELIAVESNGQFIICDKLLEGTSDDAHLYSYRTKNNVYCSPIIWDQVVNDRRQHHNGYKDDAFSFGLILLQAANMTRPSDIYQRGGTINDKNLRRHISQASARYSNVPLFGQILEKLLAVGEVDRWDFLILMSSMPTRQQIQFYFTNYNNDVYVEDQDFVNTSKMNARQVAQEYQKIAVGDPSTRTVGQGLGMSMRTGRIASQSYAARAGSGGLGMVGGQNGAVNANPRTKQAIMRERVPGERQRHVPNPGNVDYSMVDHGVLGGGNGPNQSMFNQTLTGVSAIDPHKSLQQSLNQTQPLQGDEIAYDFDGQRNKHIIHGNSAHNPHDESYSQAGGFAPAPVPRDRQNYASGVQDQKSSLKDFLDDNVAYRADQPPTPPGQRFMQQMPGPGRLPHQNVGHNPLPPQQTIPPTMSQQAPPGQPRGGPQYRYHGRGMPRGGGMPQNVGNPVGAPPGHQQPQQPVYPPQGGMGGYGGAPGQGHGNNGVDRSFALPPGV